MPLNVELPENTIIDIDCSGQGESAVLAKAVLSTYKIENDDHDLRQNPSLFEQLRGDYPVRREFSSYTVNLKNAKRETADKLRDMGFRIVIEDSDI